MYAVAVVGFIFPFGMLGWVGLTLGRGGLGIVTMTGYLIMVPLGAYRIYQVLRVRGTLDAIVYPGVIQGIRILGMVVLAIGALVTALRFTATPLMRLLLKHRSEDGVEFYAVGIYLALLSGFALAGIMLFEFGRLLGFERERHERDTAKSE
jgi:hypothetical protein